MAPDSAASAWVVERTISWLHQYRRLRVRSERANAWHRRLCNGTLTLRQAQRAELKRPSPLGFSRS